MTSLEELFGEIDDFCAQFEPRWHSQLLAHGVKTRKRAKSMSLSEIMAIAVAFHQQHYRNFKHDYLQYVCTYWQDAFPGLSSYQRFIEWLPSTLLPLCVYLKHR